MNAPLRNPVPYCPRGLPEPLPPGERILWQGAPSVAGAAVRIFHARLVAAWFGLAALALGTAAVASGAPGQAVTAVAATLGAGTLALGMLWLFAWLTHKTTVYTITDRRVVLRVGIALPISLNLPFAMTEGAGLHVFADGSGDLPLQLHPGERVAYLHLWPHARPWHVTQPEPMLRSVPEARDVAALLARALTAHGGAAAGQREETTVPVIVARPRAAEPATALVPVGAR